MRIFEVWLARVLMLLAVAVVWLGGVAPRLWAWVAGEPLVVGSRAQGPGPAYTEALHHGASVTWGAALEYRIPRPTALQRFGDLLPSLMIGLLVAAGFVLLWRLLGRAASNDPFRDDALQTFRWLSGLLAGAAVGLPLLGLLGRVLVLFPVQVRPSVYLRGSVEGFGVVLATIGAAAVVEALGYVFRRGTELRDDVDGLI